MNAHKTRPVMPKSAFRRDANSGLLIPSVEYAKIAGVRRLSKYFKELELDLYGIKHSISRNERPNISVPSALRDIERDQRTIFAVARALIEDSGMEIYSVHLRGFDLSKATPERRDQFISLCDRVHSAFNPKMAVLHPGYGDFSIFISNLSFVLEKIPESMTLVVENMTKEKAPLHSPETIRKFIELTRDFPSNLGLVIDTTHPGLPPGPVDPQSYTDLVLSYLEAALPRLRHLHLSDRGEKRKKKPTKHLPIGEGMIDWERIGNFLAANDYQGKAVIEIRFSDGDEVEKIVGSASCFYGCDRRDLKLEDKDESMPEMKKVSREELLEKVAALPALDEIQPSLLDLLDMPREGILEQSEDFIYFVVPSASYKKTHTDPYDVLTGEVDDDLNWTDYLFGVRYKGKYLSAVIIDKERRISVEETILNAYGDYKENWPRFENAVKEALEQARRAKEGRRFAKGLEFDHVNLSSITNIEIIMVGEPRAWR